MLILGHKGLIIFFKFVNIFKRCIKLVDFSKLSYNTCKDCFLCKNLFRVYCLINCIIIFY